MPGSTTSFNGAIEGAASTMSEKIDEHREAAADRIDKAASALRENAETLPAGEKWSDLARTTAGKLGAAARYMREHDAGRMLADVETLVKNNPAPSLALAAVLGFLAGRIFRNN